MMGKWLSGLETTLSALGANGQALLAASILALIIVVALLRADRTLANVVLVLAALFALGLGLTMATMPLLRPAPASAPLAADARTNGADPLLACLDGMAGDLVEMVCERALFASPGTTAAAVSYVARQLARLEAVRGTPEAQSADIQVVRRTLEADRFGLVARVMVTRDNCTAMKCSAFALLTNSSNVARNIQDEAYQERIARYAPTWNGPALASAPAMPSVPGMLAAPAAQHAPPDPARPPSNATGIDFPSASSIPPVSIMTGDPDKAPAGGETDARAQTSRPAAAPQKKQASPAPSPAPAKRAAAPQPRAAAAPTQIAPATPTSEPDDN